MTLSTGIGREQFAALLARVEAATGPDREIDTDLLLATGSDPRMYGRASLNDGGKVVWKMGDGECLSEAVARHPARKADAAIWFQVPQYTAALDATLALCERVLPGKLYEDRDWPLWMPSICQLMNGNWAANLYRQSDGLRGHGEAKTPALALLAAMLRALIAQAGAPS